MANQVVSLNQANEDKQLKISEQAEEISALNVELDKLRVKGKNGDDLSELVKPADGNCLKMAIVGFECSIGDMAAFLESGEKRKSQFVFFNYLAWSIEISKKLETSSEVTSEGTDYLSVLVRADNLANSPASWSTIVTSRVILLNQRSADQNRIFASSNIQFSDHSPSWGRNDLITLKQLRDDSFIEGDQIKFLVLLSGPALSAFGAFLGFIN